MTVTLESGITLSTLQSILGKQGQWLAIDPANPSSLSIHDLLAYNRSGPRRLRYGTIRESTLGLQIALSDGRLIKSGGQVVKNVAGYDLIKLFIGAQGSLGIITEATFKLLPLPEKSTHAERSCSSIEEARLISKSVHESRLTPAYFDARSTTPDVDSILLNLGFEGSVEEVDWQTELASEFGFRPVSNSAYFEEFCKRATEVGCHRKSVLPSTIWEWITVAKPNPWLAHLGNGVLSVVERRTSSGTSDRNPHDSSSSSQSALKTVIDRLKNSFDPHGILPAIPV